MGDRLMGHVLQCANSEISVQMLFAIVRVSHAHPVTVLLPFLPFLPSFPFRCPSRCASLHPLAPVSVHSYHIMGRAEGLLFALLWSVGSRGANPNPLP